MYGVDIIQERREEMNYNNEMCVPSRSGRWWYSVEKIVNVRRLTSSSLKKITIDWILVYELQKQAQRKKRREWVRQWGWKISEFKCQKQIGIELEWLPLYWILYMQEQSKRYSPKKILIYFNLSIFCLHVSLSLYLSHSFSFNHWNSRSFSLLFPFIFSYCLCVCACVPIVAPNATSKQASKRNWTTILLHSNVCVANQSQHSKRVC